ncbi:DUF305 domain-containing protein [uncultured Maritimibacter sp.]|jgi:uncharacterized protein (DUF305 family)|uniref:DUF305 domain-containing protein n=1 Tax=uncultured Maritimibacter sp. TaxID=991866 RepID=UPI002639E08E|nr:DUF305 domain-containing protein [uncultured Maritimibacter sp.]
MDFEYTDDDAIDFARCRIARHEGAGATAQKVLDHGDDPEMGALVDEIIPAQGRENVRRRAWLDRQGR